MSNTTNDLRENILITYSQPEPLKAIAIIKSEVKKILWKKAPKLEPFRLYFIYKMLKL